MRILRWLLLLSLSSLASAQFTTVTGTVTDPNGVPYANGTIVAILNISASPTLSGFPYQPPTQPAGLNAAGTFLMQLADNTVLLPGGSTWTFKVCSAAGTVQPAEGKGPICFTVPSLTIAGASQSISVQLQAAAQSLTIGGFAAATRTINTIPGVLITDGSGTPLEFWAKPAADPNGTWMWFGADIAGANIGLFNYDMVVEDLNNPVGQRNIKFQARDDVSLQSANGASGTPLDCGRNSINGGCLIQGNLTMSAPNTSPAVGAPGFTDSILLGVAHSPTSAGTAGRAGELVWDGTNLYLCVTTGAAGAAVWKKLVLAAD